MAVARAERTGHVAPGELETRDESAPAPRQERTDARTELEALKERIEHAKTVEPKPNERHCLDCFQRGRNAAIRVIAGSE